MYNRNKREGYIRCSIYLLDCWQITSRNTFCWDTFGLFKKDSNGFEITWRKLFPAPTISL